RWDHHRTRTRWRYRADHGDGYRPDQRHHLHLHGHRDKRRGHQPGLCAFQRRDAGSSGSHGSWCTDRGDGNRWQCPGDSKLDRAASNGGSAITSYTVTSSPAGGSATVSAPVGGTAPTTATVTGVTNGTTYTFAV